MQQDLTNITEHLRDVLENAFVGQAVTAGLLKHIEAKAHEILGRRLSVVEADRLQQIRFIAQSSPEDHDKVDLFPGNTFTAAVLTASSMGDMLPVRLEDVNEATREFRLHREKCRDAAVGQWFGPSKPDHIDVRLTALPNNLEVNLRVCADHNVVGIVARNTDGVIGVGNTLPWDSVKADMQFFKEATRGRAVIMGRKTFESLKMPLKGRLNIVLTRNRDFIPRLPNGCSMTSLGEYYIPSDSVHPTQVMVVHSYGEALRASDKRAGPAFIIGGREVYDLFLDTMNEVWVSTIKQSGDAPDAVRMFSLDLFQPGEIHLDAPEVLIRHYTRK